MKDQDIVIVHGARTPIGSFLGGLHAVTPTDLAVAAGKAALERANVDAQDIGAVFVGNVIQSSADAAYLARHVGLKLGVPTEAAALTVNRLCGSGLEALVQAANALRNGEASVVLAGGAENMSMTPYVLRGVRKGWPLAKHQTEDMLYSALFDSQAGCQIGETVEFLAHEEKISRQEADALAALSHTRSLDAQSRGILAEEIAPVVLPGRRGKTRTVEHDEQPRPNTTAEGLAMLPGLYDRKEGIVTAGNACGMNDAAAMLVVTTWGWAKERNLPVLGKLVSWGVAGVEPKRMALGPIPASHIALSRANLSIHDIDCIELNDSFAVQSIAVARAFEIPVETINPNGGALSLGHPMGATGARLALSALLQLKRTETRCALATLCIGGGQGMSVVLERPDALYA